MRKLLETVTGEQVIGYYDPRSKRMRIVSGNGADSPALVDITLAHELTHALEDQVFGLKEPEGGTDDETTARTALVEGTATFVTSEFTTLLRQRARRCCVGAFGALGAAERDGGAAALHPAHAAVLVHGGRGVRPRAAPARRAAGRS